MYVYNIGLSCIKFIVKGCQRNNGCKLQRNLDRTNKVSKSRGHTMRIGFTEKLHQNAPDPTQFQNCFLLRLQEREENQQEMTIMNYLKTPCVTCLFNFPPNLPNSNLSFALLLQRLPLSLFPFSLALLSFQTLLSQSRTLRFTFLSI